MPKSLVGELRHRKHLRDLATAVEPEETALRPLILAGQTVLDIGANFGVFTKLFSQLVGPSGSVIAFEPVPQTFRTLAAGVKRFHLGNVQAVNKAVSNEVGTALIEVPKYKGLSKKLYVAHMVSVPNSQKAFAVHTLTIDSLQPSRVDFIFRAQKVRSWRL